MNRKSFIKITTLATAGGFAMLNILVFRKTTTNPKVLHIGLVAPTILRITQPVDNYYSGTKYVDIVGVDIYSKEPEFKDYETIKKLNKIVVVSEIGPSKAGYRKYDEMEIIAKLKGNAAWFLQWHSWRNADVAIIV